MLRLVACALLLGCVVAGEPASRTPLHDAAYVLQCRIPLDRPVEVRIEELPPRVQGLCRRFDDHAEVLIAPGLSKSTQLDTLVHEWAHLMVWDVPGRDVESHDDHWSVAYGRAYRALIGER